MLVNINNDFLKITALEGEKVLRTYKIPYRNEIVLPENTTRIDIWECTNNNDVYNENIIQSIYLGKSKSIFSLAFYANSINKKLVNSRKKFDFTKAIYVETDDEIRILDVTEEDCLSVETMEDLNILVNLINEEYSQIKTSSLKLKRIFHK